MTWPAGSLIIVTVLIGQSGVGKSTLVNRFRAGRRPGHRATSIRSPGGVVTPPLPRWVCAYPTAGGSSTPRACGASDSAMDPERVLAAFGELALGSSTVCLGDVTTSRRIAV